MRRRKPETLDSTPPHWGLALDIAGFIAPFGAVGVMDGKFKRYSVNENVRVQDTRVAEYGQGKMVDIIAEDVPFNLERHELRTGISDQAIKAQGANIDRFRQNKVSNLVDQFRLAHAATVFAAVKKKTATAKVYAQTTGTPLADLDAALQAFVLRNKVRANRLLVSQEAWNIIKATDEVRKNIQYNPNATLTSALLVGALGLAPGSLEVRVGTIPHNTGTKGSNATNTNLLASELYLFHANDEISTEDMSAIKTLCLDGSDFFESVTTRWNDDGEYEEHKVKAYFQVVQSNPNAIERWTISKS